MDTVKVAKDYFLSSQSSLLIPNRDYGARKLIQVTGLPKTPVNLPSLPSLPRPSAHFRSSERAQGKGKALSYSHSDSNLQHYRDWEKGDGSADLQAPIGDVMKPSESLLLFLLLSSSSSL